MTISYNLGQESIWNFFNLIGEAAADAYEIAFYRSLNKLDNSCFYLSEFKPVYQDAAGSFPYSNPVIINGNGTAAPFYFEQDTDNPDELYYLRVTDKNGNLIWDWVVQFD